MVATAATSGNKMAEVEGTGLLDSILDNQPATDTFLTGTEREEFEHLDKAIRRDVGHYKQLGLRLREVHDRRLYREQHRTWEAYLDSVGLPRQRAHELMRDAEIANASGIPDIRQSHAAALADVPAEQRPVVLKIAAASGKVTAKSIKQAKVKTTPDGIFEPIDFDAEPENLTTCQKSDTGRHVWDEDGDGKFCSACKCDYLAKYHGEQQVAGGDFALASTATVKLTDKEIRVLKSNAPKLIGDIGAALKRVFNIEEALGAPDDELLEIQSLLRKAEKIARAKERSWASIKNKRQMGRGQ